MFSFLFLFKTNPKKTAPTIHFRDIDDVKHKSQLIYHEQQRLPFHSVHHSVVSAAQHVSLILVCLSLSVLHSIVSHLTGIPRQRVWVRETPLADGVGRLAAVGVVVHIVHVVVRAAHFEAAAAVGRCRAGHVLVVVDLVPAGAAGLRAGAVVGNCGGWRE